MKNRLVLPLMALLMTPLFTSCGPDKYQGSFNNDQVICTHGMQAIDITLVSYVKNKMHFKDDLKPEMFIMPEGCKQKEIKYVASYNNGASAFMLLKGETTLPEGETSTTINIKIDKSAFKEPSLGGTISVSLFANQIRYGSYSHEGWGAQTGEGSYEYNGEVELIGAEFIDELVNKESPLPITDGEYKIDGTTVIKIYKGDYELKKSGHIGIYEMEGDSYFIDLDMDDGVTIEDTIRIHFFSGSTTLEGYGCRFTPSGHDVAGPCIFE